MSNLFTSIVNITILRRQYQDYKVLKYTRQTENDFLILFTDVTQMVSIADFLFNPFRVNHFYWLLKTKGVALG